jgi:mono/diheme cytochrome c family protein
MNVRGIALRILPVLLLASTVHAAQFLAQSRPADARKGERTYKSACSVCHGSDGRGGPQTQTVFQRPDTFPDFARCDQTTPETDTQYRAVITHGGPYRGFSQIMPAFGEALDSHQIDDLIAYLRRFCGNPHWPRGELNLPLALVTEKAYPEHELVLAASVNARSSPGNETHIIHEQRFGVKYQIEVDVPVVFQDQDHTWYGGLGDVTLGMKRVMFSSLRTGSIMSLFGGFLLPTGNRARGFGSGTTTFETFAAFGQMFRTNTFFQLQGGAELPFHTQTAPQTVFFNSAIGQSFAGSRKLGRLWSPMCEFVATRDLMTGARTEWDVVPQMQVTLSRRQHIRSNVGVRVPISNTGGRQAQVMFYILWDWADGKFYEGW